MGEKKNFFIWENTWYSSKIKIVIFDSAKNSISSAVGGADNVILEEREIEAEGNLKFTFEGAVVDKTKNLGENSQEEKEKRKIGTRVMRRIRRLSTSFYPYIKRNSVARKRNSTSSSVMSDATVATPDEPRLQLRNVLMFLILTNVCLWIVQSLEGTAFHLNGYQSVLFLFFLNFKIFL